MGDRSHAFRNRIVLLIKGKNDMTTKQLISEAELLQNGWERLRGGEIAKTVDGVQFWLSNGKLNCFAREEHHAIPLSVKDLQLVCAYIEEVRALIDYLEEGKGHE